MVREAARAGTVDPDAGEIASRALEFPELSAADVMVPRNQVVTVNRRASPGEVRSVLLEESHSRFPVHEASADHIIGYISTKDVLAMAWEEHLFVLEDLVRPAYFIPKATKAVALLGEMRRRRTPLAIVVDEQGAMAGIVTIEDLLEELVGEIFSEHIKNVPEFYHREADGSVTVLGTVPIREVNRELGFDLPEASDWKTVAGLCLALAARIPKAGEKVRTDNGFTIQVTDASARRVRTVRITPPSPKEHR